MMAHFAPCFEPMRPRAKVIHGLREAKRNGDNSYVLGPIASGNVAI